MAVIELSAVAVTGLNEAIFRKENSIFTSGSVNVGWCPFTTVNATTYPYLLFKILKGTVPTDFSTLTTPGARSADELITFGTTNTDTFTVTTSANPVKITTPFLAASASGIATWFRMISSGSGTISHQIIGTVGIDGSGSDLEVQSTTITSGELYRLFEFKLTFPTSWTYSL